MRRQDQNISGAADAASRHVRETLRDLDMWKAAQADTDTRARLIRAIDLLFDGIEPEHDPTVKRMVSRTAPFPRTVPFAPARTPEDKP